MRNPRTASAASTVGRLARLLWPWRRQVAIAVLAAVGAAVCSVALAGTAAWLIATAAGRVPVLTLMVAIVVVRACGIGRGVLRYAERLSSHDAVLRMAGAVRERTVHGLAAKFGRGEIRPGDGDALARATADVDDLQDGLIRGVLPFLGAAVVATGATAAAWIMLPAAGWALGGGLVVALAGVPLLAGRTITAAERRAVQARGDRDRQLAEILGAADDLLLTGRWERAIAELAVADDAERTARRRQTDAAAGRAALAVLVTGAACWVAAAAGIAAVAAGTLDPVLLAVLVLLPLALTDLVSAAGECTLAISRTSAAGRRVLDLLDADAAPPARPVPPSPEPVPVTANPVIELQDVSARWPGGNTDVIEGVNLTIRPGERIGIAGPSGSGKSTLLAVLLGLLPPSGGRIIVDGRPVGPDQLSPLMGWVPAEPHLFDSTIERNVRLGRPSATTSEVERACAAAGLTPWLAGLPDGIATRVGDRALAVSGGERQRIAVARAVLADRPVLLADEPAAHLDGRNADAVTATVLAADPRRSTVLVTHREQDLAAVDTVLRLVPRGPDQPAASMLTRPPVASDTAM